MATIHVKDEYRTNPLSLEPGGHQVTVFYDNGSNFVYDKVKKPSSYIRNIYNKEKGARSMTRILVDGNQVWSGGAGTQPWEF
jgi:hypothetical protein